MDKEIVDYFTKFGLTVDWDICGGVKYYEFCYDGQCLVQIDMYIPLEEILKDLRYMKNKTGELSKFDYVIYGPEEEFQKFLSLLDI